MVVWACPGTFSCVGATQGWMKPQLGFALQACRTEKGARESSVHAGKLSQRRAVKPELGQREVRTQVVGVRGSERMRTDPGLVTRL